MIQSISKIDFLNFGNLLSQIFAGSGQPIQINFPHILLTKFSRSSVAEPGKSILRKGLKMQQIIHQSLTVVYFSLQSIFAG
jgi:hypothetical protein